MPVIRFILLYNLDGGKSETPERPRTTPKDLTLDIEMAKKLEDKIAVAGFKSEEQRQRDAPKINTMPVEVVERLRAGQPLKLRQLSGKDGIPKHHTTEAASRIYNDLGYDPLAAAVAVARGEALTRNHPLLPVIKDALSNWMRRSANNEPISVDEIEGLLNLSINLLTDSWVSPELRSKHIKLYIPQAESSTGRP